MSWRASRTATATDLAFTYENGLLVRAEVNGAGRRVDFTYDGQNRIAAIADFTGRSWRYGYDDIGDLGHGHPARHRAASQRADVGLRLHRTANADAGACSMR